MLGGSPQPGTLASDVPPSFPAKRGLQEKCPKEIPQEFRMRGCQWSGSRAGSPRRLCPPLFLHPPCLRNSEQGGASGVGVQPGHHRGSVPHFSCIPHTLQLLCCALVDMDTCSLKERRPPSIESWKVNGSDSKRTATRGAGSRPPFGTRSEFHLCRNKHCTGPENAGQGASRFTTYRRFPISTGICVYTLFQH